MVCPNVTPSSTHIDGQRYVGKMFEACNSNHQAGKTRLFTQFAFFLNFQALQTLIFTVFISVGAPERAYPSERSNSRLYMLFRLGPTLGASVTWLLLSPAQ